MLKNVAQFLQARSAILSRCVLYCTCSAHGDTVRRYLKCHYLCNENRFKNHRLLEVVPAPFTLRPFAGLYNPYHYGCSVLCNHPADGEAKAVVRRAKDTLPKRLGSRVRFGQLARRGAGSSSSGSRRRSQGENQPRARSQGHQPLSAGQRDAELARADPRADPELASQQRVRPVHGQIVVPARACGQQKNSSQRLAATSETLPDGGLVVAGALGAHNRGERRRVDAQRTDESRPPPGRLGRLGRRGRGRGGGQRPGRGRRRRSRWRSAAHATSWQAPTEEAQVSQGLDLRPADRGARAAGPARDSGLAVRRRIQQTSVSIQLVRDSCLVRSWNNFGVFRCPVHDSVASKLDDSKQGSIDKDTLPPVKRELPPSFLPPDVIKALSRELDQETVEGEFNAKVRLLYDEISNYIRIRNIHVGELAAPLRSGGNSAGHRWIRGSCRSRRHVLLLEPRCCGGGGHLATASQSHPPKHSERGSALLPAEREIPAARQSLPRGPAAPGLSQRARAHLGRAPTLLRQGLQQAQGRDADGAAIPAGLGAARGPARRARARDQRLGAGLHRADLPRAGHGAPRVSRLVRPVRLRRATAAPAASEGSGSAGLAREGRFRDAREAHRRRKEMKTDFRVRGTLHAITFFYFYI
ncbi:unnamed protein product [Trichogramma brassicae]|uniref:Uncharacterized protein n=1 Tax=Trichogramma brassicae TaxID=86971 RepID=A0A6H5I8A0_9HYME|nr:unnamed protein product [Trichogramma brassicae]